MIRKTKKGPRRLREMPVVGSVGRYIVCSGVGVPEKDIQKWEKWVKEYRESQEQ